MKRQKQIGEPFERELLLPPHTNQLSERLGVSYVRHCYILCDALQTAVHMVQFSVYKWAFNFFSSLVILDRGVQWHAFYFTRKQW